MKIPGAARARACAALGPGPVGAPLGGDPLPLLFGGRLPARGDCIVSP